MTPELAAQRLSELGNITRLGAFRLLVRAGSDGMNITEVRDRMDVPLSTLSFHLRGLVQAGLVTQEKVGRAVICRADYEALNSVIGFLQAECCEGLPTLDAIPDRGVTT